MLGCEACRDNNTIGEAGEMQHRVLGVLAWRRLRGLANVGLGYWTKDRLVGKGHGESSGVLQSM
jgi:hypothetical protein